MAHYLSPEILAFLDKLSITADFFIFAVFFIPIVILVSIWRRTS
jgi:hypothetical protein